MKKHKKPVPGQGIIQELKNRREEIQGGNDWTITKWTSYANSLTTLTGVRVAIINDLLEMIQDTGYRTVRRELIYALGKLKTRRLQSIPVLTGLLTDPEVASAALDVLAELKAVEAEAEIRKAATSKNPGTQFFANRTLRRIGLEPGASEDVLTPWRNLTPWLSTLPKQRAMPLGGFEIEPTLRHVFSVGRCQNASADDLHHMVYRIGEIKRALRVQIFGFRFTLDDVPDIPLMVEAMKLNKDDWVLKLHSIPPFLEAIANLPVPKAVPDSYEVPDGFTALHVACIHGNIEAVENELSANPSAINERETTHGNTPLMLAAFNWNPQVVTLLLERGADLSAQGHGGQTALHQAAYGGSPETIQLLIKAGAEVDASCSAGTPLFFAAHVGFYQAVEVLLNAGASIEAFAVDGETAVDAAWAGESPSTEKLLRQFKGVR